MSKIAKKAASNVTGSPVSTLAGLGLAALNLYANGTEPKQIGVSIGAALLGALIKDPNLIKFGK